MAKSVLIVDDIPFVRKTLSDIFSDAHYQVVGEAVDGNDGVNQFAKLKPDVVTMDIVMPNLGGIDAIRKILRIEKTAKVIVVSAMGQENLVMEAINVGARDYILKPFVKEDVLKSIERVLAGETLMGKNLPRL